jgi:hypothetical protein
VVLIGFGCWFLGNAVINYLQENKELTDSKADCNGVQCICNNLICVTKDTLINSYEGYFGLGIGLILSGSIILVVSRKLWI